MGAASRTRNLERTRDALVDAAAQMIARKGSDVSFDEIAGEAGYTRGALHHQFSSRTELLLAVLRRRNEALQAASDLAEVEMPADPAALAARWATLHDGDHDDVALRLEMRGQALRSAEVRQQVVEVERDAIAATAAQLDEVSERTQMRWRYPVDHLAELLHVVSRGLRERAVLTGEDVTPAMETVLTFLWRDAIEPAGPADR